MRMPLVQSGEQCSRFRSLNTGSDRKQEQCSQFGRVMRHTGVMAVHRTARALAREAITAEIMETARRQLAEDGAAGLSLRSITRELGMVSSAIYRYVDSRDD